MPVIATNTSANTALIYLNKNSSEQSKSLAKLSSGSRIVVASDDAAGLAVGSKLKADVTVLKQAATNALQAGSVLQTVDGALSRVGDILQRMKSLAAQANSGSVDATGRGFIQTEYAQLSTEINDIALQTKFNGTNLVNGSFNQNFQVGISSSDIITVNLSSVNVSTASTGMGNLSGTNVVSSAANASTALDTAINTISTARATVGAFLSRFQYRGDVINSSVENLQAAASAIMDVDIAAEQANLVSKQVLTEASIAALSQANQMKSSLLALVR